MRTKPRRLEIEVPEAVHMSTRVRVESGETVVWIAKRDEKDWDNRSWDFHNATYPTFNEALTAANKYVEMHETERLLQIALDEKKYG